MKKLVSRSPIQRFKQGKVIKAQSGAPVYNNAYYEIRDSQGNIIERGRRTTGRPNKVYQEVVNQDLPNVTITGRKKQSKNSTQQTPYPNGYYTNNKSNVSTRRNKQRVFASGSGKTPVVNKPTNRAATGYALPEGVTDVAAMQRQLKEGNYYNQNYINSGAKIDDGIWGKETQAAWEAYKNKLAAPQEQRVASVVPNIPTPPTQITVERTPVTYDRAQTRDVMRMMGYNPYAFTGAQRKQLRQYLNGESNDTSLLSDIDLSKFRNNNTQSSDTPLIATSASTIRRFTIPDYVGQFRSWVQSQPLFSGYAKQGGKLISRNPVKQFKQK